MTEAAQSRSIFLVEDDEAVRAMLGQHLSRQGHDVVVARDAETLLKNLVGRSAFDVVLTDIHLPGLSGLDLLRLVQAHSPMKPVLLITGDDDERLAIEALRSGASGYLLKPFELFEMDAMLGQALQRLTLLEQTGALEERRDASAFVVPIPWLELADERSGAGLGHGRRVERFARMVLKQMGPPSDPQVIEQAARLHEIARLMAVDAAHSDVPALTASFLSGTAVSGTVRDAIAGMSERWDGAGPGGVRGEANPPVVLALSAADAIDHGASRLVQDGEFPPTAIMRALEDLVANGEALFGPHLVDVLRQHHEVLSAIWILGRGGYPAPAGPGSQS